jgi:hypothetical protein
MFHARNCRRFRISFQASNTRYAKDFSLSPLHLYIIPQKKRNRNHSIPIPNQSISRPTSVAQEIRGDSQRNQRKTMHIRILPIPQQMINQQHGQKQHHGLKRLKVQRHSLSQHPAPQH